MKNVLCVKWGDKYSPEYVNHLYNMVNRNLTDFRFVCFTDDKTDINKEIECLPLPIDLDLKGWWFKLFLFKNGLYDLTGQALFLDLDIVVINKLEPFFDLPGDFCGINDWLYFKHNKYKINSSVLRFDLNKHEDIWESFLKDKKNILAKYPGDQDWISKKRQHATFWPKNWCISFKYSRAWKSVPPDSKIVVFHGLPNPKEAINGYKSFPPAPWIANFWR